MLKPQSPPPADAPASTETPAPATEPSRPTFRYRVALHCPTPIPHQELEVEAADDGAAWQKFCAANGISDSEHERTVVRCP